MPLALVRTDTTTVYTHHLALPGYDVQFLDEIELELVTKKIDKVRITVQSSTVDQEVQSTVEVWMDVSRVWATPTKQSEMFLLRALSEAGAQGVPGR